MELGFVRLGKMGLNMATRLVRGQPSAGTRGSPSTRPDSGGRPTPIDSSRKAAADGGRDDRRLRPERELDYRRGWSFCAASGATSGPSLEIRA